GCKLNRKSAEEHRDHSLLELFPEVADRKLLLDLIEVAESGSTLKKEIVSPGLDGQARTMAVHVVLLNGSLACTWRELDPKERAICTLYENKACTRIEENEREQRNLAEALRATAGLLNSSLRVDDVLERILENIERVFDHKTAN